MKRHEQLKPLSRQHHNGLLMALLLTKGIKKKADVKVMNDFIRQGWIDELKEHFDAEETVLIPALHGSSFSPQLTERLLAEHHDLRLLIKKATELSASEDDIICFSGLLEKHIRFEEKIYFPEAESHLSEQKLLEIGKKLAETSKEKNCINYPVTFWE